MSGHYALLDSDFFSSAKIKCNFQSHQIFSAGYSTRLYMYLGIYNRYSDDCLSIAGKGNTVSPDFPNYFGHGSRYSVLAPFFSAKCTRNVPYGKRYRLIFMAHLLAHYSNNNLQFLGFIMLIIPQIYAF